MNDEKDSPQLPDANEYTWIPEGHDGKWTGIDIQSTYTSAQMRECAAEFARRQNAELVKALQQANAHRQNLLTQSKEWGRECDDLLAALRKIAQFKSYGAVHTSIGEAINMRRIAEEAITAAGTPAALAAVGVPDYEAQRAIMEGERNAAAEEYFKARPQLDFIGNRRIFESGFQRGFERTPAAQTRHLTILNEAAPAAPCQAAR
jgi:hypothetical protein